MKRILIFWGTVILVAGFVLFWAAGVRADQSVDPDHPVVLTGWEWCPEGYWFDGGPYPPSPGEMCIITLEGTSMHLTHVDAVYNCCIDDIVIDVTINSGLIRIIEYEVWTNPCWCFCYFEASVQIKHLKPGAYTVEVWSHWMNGEEDLRCIEEISVPGHCISSLMQR
ncbi:hypothetical protein JXA40_02595 [bacterium]|nr:hypothetical protein [candidate division CSSED10-310 bacterium]